MGIKGLKGFLNKFCQENNLQNTGVYHFNDMNEFLRSEKRKIFKNDIIKKKIFNPIKQADLKIALENKPYVVGIDVYLYASKYKRVFPEIIYGFLKQIMLCLSHKILPVYVFDGNAPKEKKRTITKRKNRKQKNQLKLNELLEENIKKTNLQEITTCATNVYLQILKNNPCNVDMNTDNNINKTNCKEIQRLTKKTVSVEQSDIKNLKRFLDILKIPHITAKEEADDLIALLYKKNIIDACQSDDMDMLPKGCGNLIQISKTGVTQFVLDDILSCLNLTYNQFIDFCILLGCDYYNIFLPKLKPLELFNYFKSNPTLELFIESYSLIDKDIYFHLEFYQKARLLFLLSKENVQTQISININEVPLFSLEMIKNVFINLGIPFEPVHVNKYIFLFKNINCFVKPNIRSCAII